MVLSSSVWRWNAAEKISDHNRNNRTAAPVSRFPVHRLLWIPGLCGRRNGQYDRYVFRRAYPVFDTLSCRQDCCRTGIKKNEAVGPCALYRVIGTGADCFPFHCLRLSVSVCPYTHLCFCFNLVSRGVSAASRF